MICLFDRLANAFPLWVLAACGLELVEPGLFTWFRGNAIVIGLAVIMLGMGLGLTFDDFLRVTTRPTTVAVGFIHFLRWLPFTITDRSANGTSTSVGSHRARNVRLSTRSRKRSWNPLPASRLARTSFSISRRSA